MKKITGTLLGIGATLLVTAGWAIEAGDVLVRVGPIGVFPNDRSTSLNNLGISDAKASVGNAWSGGLTLAYMATDNIGVELVGAYPFTHTIRGDGSISSLDRIGDTKQLPPTLLAQYYFFPK